MRPNLTMLAAAAAMAGLAGCNMTLLDFSDRSLSPEPQGPGWTPPNVTPRFVTQTGGSGEMAGYTYFGGEDAIVLNNLWQANSTEITYELDGAEIVAVLLRSSDAGPSGTISPDREATVTFRRDLGDTITVEGDMLRLSKAGSDYVSTVIDPRLSLLNYQSFGYWFDEGNALAVFASAGSRTPVADMPTSGNATYNGQSVGILEYDRTAGPGGRESYHTRSDVELSTSDFSTIDFSMTGTEVARTNDPSNWQSAGSAGLPNLNISEPGITIAGNTFSRNYVPGSGREVSIDGQFYGPGAEEVGGTFVNINNNVPFDHRGSFGARTPRD